jgi:small-conductance mechanosensitive channel
MFVVIIGIATVWIQYRRALLVAYGLLAAGVAVVLQDYLRNFVGGIAIVTSNLYKVGDRIQVGETIGDVMDIGLLYTTVMEIRSWVDGDQPTGRIVHIPNLIAVSKPVHNYTKDHSFIWDEIVVALTHDSNWKKARGILYGVLRAQTDRITRSAESEIERLGMKYYLTKRDVEPQIYARFVDQNVELHLRFVSFVKDRRVIANRITQEVLRMVEENPDISAPVQGIDVLHFPKQ